MTTAPVEAPTPGARINEAVVAFTGCIGDSLDICSYGWTIGDSYVPFDPDPEDSDVCDEEEVYCSQAWVRVMGVTPLAVESWSGDCGATMQITLEVGVLRCVEVPEGGEAPNATSVLIAAMQATDDMNAVYCAAMECEVWESISSGEWTPMGPQGGQYGGLWTFTVEI